MIEVFERRATGRHVLATKPTLEEAMAYVEGLGVVLLEKDADYLDCADAFLKDGRVLTIQPEGFTLG